MIKKVFLTAGSFGMMRKHDNDIVTIITTGGTIEKSYDELEGSLINKTTIVETNIINRLRYPGVSIEVKPTLTKDSLYISDEDREILVSTLVSTLEKKNPIVVLHGTDTMDKTVDFVLKYLPKEKLIAPVVFTGAMKPMVFMDSDAMQNIVEAIFASRIIEAGVYLSFHGKLFNGGTFVKDRNKGTFIIK
ncbi:asparaginase [Bacteriovoracaceae bacterium]|nr:asparaginase [Bacteriovoracaceae bacterium]